ncbi:MAG: hypothetical protein SGJ27_27225 [Candidatus Melainabacteria bacterium]|nr:hypothetical protein [Candidatus Melainabacteria bacterium]
MSIFEVLVLIFVAWLVIDSFDHKTKLNLIAQRLTDIHDLMKANAPKQVEDKEEDVPLDELYRRFRIDLEVGQRNKR